MATATYNKFNDFVEQLGKAVHNMSTHTFKAMLTNTAPVAANTIKADLTDIAAGNGYTAGGFALAGVAWSETAGVAKFSANDFTITAAGGSIGPFRYLVIYNDTATSPADALVGFYDYGTNLTLADSQSLDVDFDGTNGIFDIS